MTLPILECKVFLTAATMRLHFYNMIILNCGPGDISSDRPFSIRWRAALIK
jgi:hypothetical protein